MEKKKEKQIEGKDGRNILYDSVKRMFENKPHANNLVATLRQYSVYVQGILDTRPEPKSKDEKPK